MASDPRRVQEVFLAAVEQVDGAARTALLGRECGGDDELRRHVEALLAAHDASGSFLGSPAIAATGAFTSGIDQMALRADVAAADRAGTVLAGRYKLVEE